MMNILVFPCGNENALEILNSLSFSTNFKVFGGSSEDSIGSRWFKNYIEELPYIWEDNFYKKLNKVIIEYKIDLIFPTHDAVVFEFAKNRSRISCDVVVPSLKTAEIIYDKHLTYKHFIDSEFTPKIIDIENIKEFPIFIKKRIGRLAEGSSKINSIYQLNEILSKIDRTEYVFNEFLPGSEYTVECFSDNKGDLKIAEARKMKKYIRGIFLESSSTKDNRFVKIAKEINENLDFKGLWYFQCKEDKNGDIKLLEIAQKASGTMALLRSSGINLPLLTAQMFCEECEQFSIKRVRRSGSLKRFFFNTISLDLKIDEIFLDLDSLKKELKTSPYLLPFLFQSKEKNISIFGFADEIDDSFYRYFCTEIFMRDELERKEIREDGILISNDRTLLNQRNGITQCFTTDEVMYLFDWRK